MSMGTRSLLIAALLAAAPATGCGDAEKVSAATMDAVASDPTACQEQHPEGVVAFAVGPDGAVRAGVVGADGKPATIDGGTLTFREEGGAPTEAKLTPEGDGTVATARGPALDADVTAIDYAVQTGGKTLSGVLHLPAGGTKALAESSRAAAPEAAPGPNGGQVQVVAGEPVEVAVRPDGEVVAVVLGADRKPVTTVAGRTLWLLVDGEKVPLAPREDGVFVGRTKVVAPHKITLVEVKDGAHHVVVVGHRPGVKVVATEAPGLVVVKSGRGPVDKNPDEPGMGWAKGKEKHDDHPGKGDDHGPDEGGKPAGAGKPENAGPPESAGKPGSPGKSGDAHAEHGSAGKGAGKGKDGGKPEGKGKK